VRKVQHGRKSGPKPLDEEELVTFLIDACKMGQGRTKREVIDIKVYVEKEKKGKTIDHFKFNGEGWWAGSPNLSLQTSDVLSYCKSNAIDQESITFYYIKRVQGILNRA